MPLLVVPGKEWLPSQLDLLRRLAEEGHELVAHGWDHRVRSNKGFYHRVYAAVLSRNAGEHLALDAGAIKILMEKSHAWFIENRLPAPSLYVPPAWALGPIPMKSLSNLPFTHIETLGGYLAPHTGSKYRIPVIGFEADCSVRAHALGGYNILQLNWCRLTSRPVRIALHPNDFHLPLAGQLRQVLQAPLRCMGYSDVTG